MKQYFRNIAIAFDQLINCLIKGGTPDETLSSRAWRLSCNNKYWYSKIPCKIINALFFWQNNHCRGAYTSELERKHLPDELRK